MSAAVFLRSGKPISVPERLVSFAFFSFGSLAAFYGAVSFPGLVSTRLCLGLFFAALLILSASALGWILLPIGLFVFGVYAQQTVLAWYDSLTAFPASDLKPLAFVSVLVLAVFLAFTHGLRASSACFTAFRRASPTARSDFYHEITAALFYALFGLLTVFYFT